MERDTDTAGNTDAVHEACEAQADMERYETLRNTITRQGPTKAASQFTRLFIEAWRRRDAYALEALPELKIGKEEADRILRESSAFMRANAPKPLPPNPTEKDMEVHPELKAMLDLHTQKAKEHDEKITSTLSRLCHPPSV